MNRNFVALFMGTVFLISGKISHASDIVIETRILEKDPFSGMKSRQNITYDFKSQKITQKVETGTTDLGVVVVESIRDDFKTEFISGDANSLSFRAIGTTASGVVVMPDIDYNFIFDVKSNGIISVKGCHDGYPAYIIKHHGKVIYKYDHPSVALIKLLGTCDTIVDLTIQP